MPVLNGHPQVPDGSSRAANHEHLLCNSLERFLSHGEQRFDLIVGNPPREHSLPAPPVVDTSALLQLCWHHALVKDSGQLTRRAKPRDLPLCLYRRKVPISCLDGGARGGVLEQMLALSLTERPELSLRAQEVDVIDRRKTVAREAQGPDSAWHKIDRDHFLDPFTEICRHYRCGLFSVFVRRHDSFRDLPVRGLAFRHGDEIKRARPSRAESRPIAVQEPPATVRKFQQGRSTPHEASHRQALVRRLLRIVAKPGNAYRRKG